MHEKFAMNLGKICEVGLQPVKPNFVFSYQIHGKVPCCMKDFDEIRLCQTSYSHTGVVA